MRAAVTPSRYASSALFSIALSQPFQPFLKSLDITIFEEVVITTMGGLDSPDMLNRTPVLLGTGGNFPSIGGETISVSAVEAVELFNNVQIGEILAIKEQILGALHLGNTVDWKTGTLVYGEE